ncbi:MAG: cell division protein ZapE [Brevundimonas sp.]|uniref:cell division protein ZapE n=1 Tax=Brevundimonas sp. TaxID=1871086 RepID=UPI00391D3E68
MTSALRQAYLDRLRDGALQADEAQQQAIEALERLEHDLGRRTLTGRRRSVQGVYLWGPPGRGKSMLMDLFYAHSAEKRRLRAHFHAFMAQVHEDVRLWREGTGAQKLARFGTVRGSDPVGPIADRLARQVRLLCFDELQVTDIADAMILGRLFEALFARKVVLAATSNRRPDQLYANGINRQLFLPFIARIEAQCDVVEVAGARDWRAQRMASSRVWYSGLDTGRKMAFEHLWEDLRGAEPEEPTRLTLKGRELVLERTVGAMARATFDELCARALGPQDYLAIAARFHTLFIEAVPVLGPERRFEARRLVTLIDALYEAKVRIVVLAEAEPQALYPQGEGAFEFERTVSRLREMSAVAWLQQER